MQNHLHQPYIHRRVLGFTHAPVLLRRTVRGFTFIEIMTVVAIISVLAAAIIAGTLQIKIRSRDARRVDDVASIVKAVNMYATENFSYPIISDILGECLGIGATIDGFLTKFLSTVPKDPLQTIALNRPSGKCGQLPTDNNQFYYYYDRIHLCSGRRTTDNPQGQVAEIHIQRLETLTYPSNQPANLCPNNPIGSTGDNGQFLDADYAIILDEAAN